MENDKKQIKKTIETSMRHDENLKKRLKFNEKWLKVLKSAEN